MKIIKSQIVEDLAQAKGCGRDIREEHIWDDGTVTEVSYRIADKLDAKKLMEMRITTLEAQRAEDILRAAEVAALQQKRAEAIAKLDVNTVADILVISTKEAEQLGAKKEVVVRG